MLGRLLGKLSYPTSPRPRVSDVCGCLRDRWCFGSLRGQKRHCCVERSLHVCSVIMSSEKRWGAFVLPAGRSSRSARRRARAALQHLALPARRPRPARGPRAGSPIKPRCARFPESFIYEGEELREAEWRNWSVAAGGKNPGLAGLQHKTQASQACGSPPGQAHRPGWAPARRGVRPRVRPGAGKMRSLPAGLAPASARAWCGEEAAKRGGPEG